MYRFTAEGRRLAQETCPITGAKHEPEPAAGQVGTFFCARCGAIPKDSIWYDMDERYARDPQGQDHR